MRLACSLLIAAGMTVPAVAHHGWGSYDADNPLSIEGEIVEITLQNPHGEMVVPHNGEAWVVTLAPLSRMNARGATESILRSGATIAAYGYPRRDGTLEIRAEWVEVDGQRFQLR